MLAGPYLRALSEQPYRYYNPIIDELPRNATVFILWAATDKLAKPPYSKNGLLCA